MSLWNKNRFVITKNYVYVLLDYLKSKITVNGDVQNWLLGKILVLSDLHCVKKKYKIEFGRSFLENSLNGINYKCLIVIKESVYPKDFFFHFLISLNAKWEAL